MAGGYLAIGACISALTKNQVIAFVVTIVICFMFTVSGAPIVLDFFSAWAPQAALDQIANFSFLRRFQAITNGVIDLRDVVYFLSLIGFWLFAALVAVERNKAA